MYIRVGNKLKLSLSCNGGILPTNISPTDDDVITTTNTHHYAQSHTHTVAFARQSFCLVCLHQSADPSLSNPRAAAVTSSTTIDSH